MFGVKHTVQQNDPKFKRSPFTPTRFCQPNRKGDVFLLGGAGPNGKQGVWFAHAATQVRVWEPVDI